ncbi:hypothetical protein NKDENANG_00366 [Candidatus Entotheonellaceae bacterium PAL068K]
MSIRRVFIDWREPALLSTVEYLCTRYASNGMLDLQQVIVVLPGGRAGRRLLEILVDVADARQLTPVPARFVTAGELPELLYDAKRPFANALTQQLAWVEALRHTDSRELASLTHHLPADNDLFAWLALGEILATLHRELAGDGLMFADVARRGQTLASFHESARWQALATIQTHYLQALEDRGFWDQQRARLWSIDQNACQTEYDIILVGTIDLNATQRAMLDQVADRVTTLIFAPSPLSNHFDAHGCIIAAAWQDKRIDLDTANIVFADRPADQADALVRVLAGYNGAFAADDITIGVPDTRIIPYVQQRLGECDLPSRYGTGTPVMYTSPCRLLRAVAEYLDNDTFAAFANLVRHPAIEPWLTLQGVTGNWLAELDDYYSAHLPARLHGQWAPEQQPREQLHLAFAAVKRLLAPFKSDARQPRRWTNAVLELMIQVYGQVALNSDNEADRMVIVACEKIQHAVKECLQVHESLAPRVSGSVALRLVLQTLEDVTVPPRIDQEAIELLGWLELPLDDAPAIAVTGFNEGCVSESQNGDLFLPNALRSQLGLQDNARRYARDAYNLALLAASRASLTLITGRRTPDNDVLLPSRLLFACDDDCLLSRTHEAFSSPRPERWQVMMATSLKPGGTSGFVIPRPVPLSAPVTSMRVTEFHDYLVCPYRYYLKHHLNLQTVDTTAEELDPGGFGNLLHEVLRAFGQGPAARSNHAGEIRQSLNRILDKMVFQWFGHEPLPAVRVQVEQARWRLDQFADWQADWSRQGWSIEYTELLVGGRRSWLQVDGMPMYLRGRIDRIDIHQGTRARIIFDYKTGETAKEPEAAHRKRQSEWVDLQLPLYRHLVKGLGIEDNVQLGYILLPKDLKEIGERIAPWSHEALTDADQVAAEVVRHVRAETFWPPSSATLATFDEFAAICQTEQFGATDVHALENED